MLFKKKEKVKPVRTYLQIRLKEEEKEALKNMAESYGMTLTDFIKNACNEYAQILENNKK